MRDLINSMVEKKVNPFKKTWEDFYKGIITKRELQKVLGEWALKRVPRYQYREFPPRPKEKKYKEGWLARCRKIKYENISNEYRLRQLLTRIDEGIIEAEQGKIEEIGEILVEYPRRY